MIQVILLKVSKNNPTKFQVSFICRLTKRVIPIRSSSLHSLTDATSFLPPSPREKVPFAVGHVTTNRPADRRPCQSAASEATAASNNNERESWFRNKYEMANFATGNTKKPGEGLPRSHYCDGLIRTLVPLYPSAATPTSNHE